MVVCVTLYNCGRTSKHHMDNRSPTHAVRLKTSTAYLNESMWFESVFAMTPLASDLTLCLIICAASSSFSEVEPGLDHDISVVVIYCRLNKGFPLLSLQTGLVYMVHVQANILVQTDYSRTASSNAYRKQNWQALSKIMAGLRDTGMIKQRVWVVQLL